jgi:molybdopterin molybdotransferase
VSLSLPAVVSAPDFRPDDADLSVDAARAAIAAAVRPIADREEVALRAANGRVLAVDVVSPIDVPVADNAAMDGYAFAGRALATGVALTLRAVGTVLAGQTAATSIGDGECVRIMTGATMPPGLDTVVPLEQCRVDGDRVVVPADVVKAGKHRRVRGEELARGGNALAAGRVLSPADIGLAASLGLERLTVMRRLRVAVFSTGDEIVAPGRPLPPGHVYDANRHALIAALERLGVEVMDLGLVRDDVVALERTLREAIATVDAIVTSGGVSAGDADFTRETVAKLGAVAFWKVSMRPGRPFAFGALEDDGRRAWLFALPGNPVAAFIAFHVFARDALAVLAGARPHPRTTWSARSLDSIRKRVGRTEFHPGIVQRDVDGRWSVRLATLGASLRGLSESDVIVALPADRGPVAADEIVEVWSLDGTF